MVQWWLVAQYLRCNLPAADACGTQLEATLLAKQKRHRSFMLALMRFRARCMALLPASASASGSRNSAPSCSVSSARHAAMMRDEKLTMPASRIQHVSVQDVEAGCEALAPLTIHAALMF